MSVNSVMTVLADAIRGKSGRTGTMTLEEMAEAVNSISVGEGGLPSGISALESGTYTATENKTARVDVEHGLGVKPNFAVVIVEEDFSTTPGTTMLVGSAAFYKKTKNNTSATTVTTVHLMMEGYNSSSQVGGNVTRAVSADYFTDTTFGIPCNGTYPLKPGYTYRWVCGVMDNI